MGSISMSIYDLALHVKKKKKKTLFCLHKISRSANVSYFYHMVYRVPQLARHRCWYGQPRALNNPDMVVP